MSISRAARCSRLVFAPVLLVGTLLGTAGLVAPAAGAGPSAPSGPSGSWTNTFDEEFNGTAVDTTKWEPDRYGQDYGGDTPFNPGSEAAWFNTGNVSVSGGNLHLTIRNDPRTLNGKTYPYSSGVVQTAQHHLFTAGTYLESRINVPVCDGCWPAFWTAAPDVWPPEIDGFEYFDTGGSGADTSPQFNYHPPAGGQTGPTVYGDPAMDYRGSFHTYGLLWDGTQAVPYLDGVAYPSGANSDMTRLDQFLLLNLSVQGGHHPTPGSEMLVDWVRAWSPAPATEMHGAIAEHYYNTPGLAALLGPTTTPELTTPDTVGRYNHFTGGDGGSIYWTPTPGPSRCTVPSADTGNPWAGKPARPGTPPPMSAPPPTAWAATTTSPAATGHPSTGPRPPAPSWCTAPSATGGRRWAGSAAHWVTRSVTSTRCPAVGAATSSTGPSPTGSPTGPS